MSALHFSWLRLIHVCFPTVLQDCGPFSHCRPRRQDTVPRGRRQPVAIHLDYFKKISPFRRRNFEPVSKRTMRGPAVASVASELGFGHPLGVPFLPKPLSHAKRLSEFLEVKCAIPNRGALLEPILGGVSPTLSSAFSFARRSFFRRISEHVLERPPSCLSVQGTRETPQVPSFILVGLALAPGIID